MIQKCHNPQPNFLAILNFQDFWHQQKIVDVHIPNSRSPMVEAVVFHGIEPHSLMNRRCENLVVGGQEGESRFLLPLDGCFAAHLAAQTRAFCALALRESCA